MAGGVRRLRGLWRFKPLAVLALGWALGPLLESRTTELARENVVDALYRVLSGFPSMAVFAERALGTFLDAMAFAWGSSVALGTVALPLGFVARMIARARVRAVHVDPLDRVRRWLADHRVGRQAVTAAVPAAVQLFLLHFMLGNPGWFGHALTPANLALLAACLGSGMLAQRWVVRGALRALLAPTFDQGEDRAPRAIDPHEICFDAVAVTPETRGAVAAVAALSLGTIAWTASQPIAALFRDPHVFAVMGAYAALTAGVAWAFRRASRVAVGLDGVYVGGSSRPRFYAFRDVDEARERNGDLELVRRGRVLLRLQFHGQDAARRDAIGARIRDGIARAAEVQRDAAANFVASSSTSRVARSAQGGADYRMPSVSRDALWQLVEGAGVHAEARKAAAQALADMCEGAERERLRVAAEHCADPAMRVELEEFAEVEEAAPARASHARS